MSDASVRTPCAVVMMGVSGSGKTTIGEQLASRLGWRYLESDAFQPHSNVVKMSAGHPLTDEDRVPWLRSIANEIDRACTAGAHVVVTCSALKRRYRDVLMHGRDDVRLVYLEGSQPLIAGRLARRTGHFMPAGLLDSQFKILEPPDGSERALTVSVEPRVETIVDNIVRQLGFAPAEAGAQRRNSS